MPRPTIEAEVAGNQFVCPSCMHAGALPSTNPFSCPGCKTPLSRPAPKKKASAYHEFVKFICPNCWHAETMEAEVAGKEIECPGCGATVRAPDEVQRESKAKAKPVDLKAKAEKEEEERIEAYEGGQVNVLLFVLGFVFWGGGCIAWWITANWWLGFFGAFVAGVMFRSGIPSGHPLRFSLLVVEGLANLGLGGMVVAIGKFANLLVEDAREAVIVGGIWAFYGMAILAWGLAGLVQRGGRS